ncbi:AAA family ATPase [Amycolatopsis sp. NPDC049688]|uniref:NACHT domain-containing protein n=1 Tax=Amycolatopsis sp. NPDC049688 TaxID=3154733 RepID=UPI00341E0101
MPLIPAMTFRGALGILGHHEHATLAKIDKLLGGAIIASGAVALGAPVAGPLLAVAALWGWVDQKNEATMLIRSLLDVVAGRRFRARGTERADLIAAAHTVLVISSLMEVFRERVDKTYFQPLKASSQAQSELLDDDLSAKCVNLVDALLGMEVPIPSASKSFHENLVEVASWQGGTAARIYDFCERLNTGGSIKLNLDSLTETARRRYESRYYELAAKVPDFFVWSLVGEHGATQVKVDSLQVEFREALSEQSRALSRLQSILTAATGLVDERCRILVDVVRRAAISNLDSPILPVDTSEVLSGGGIVFPPIRDIYLEPRYRIARFAPGMPVSGESWWEEREVHDDLDIRLVAHFLSPESRRLPILLLGHPGAGKSMLSKVLAARLPGDSFTTVHVPLRHVTADAPIYRQIQQGLDLVTHERVGWEALTEQSCETVRVVLLDGLDELLQASNISRRSFLHEVAEFQRLELAQGKPVAVMVTSRTVVVDQVEIPNGVAVVKLEEFTDAQIERWRLVWNRANGDAIARGMMRELTAQSAHAVELARQPLLLLMIALYSADSDVPPIDRGLSQTALYQRLIDKFAEREASKSAYLGKEELAAFVRGQIHRLSVAALGMFNRGRQHITDIELGEDLAVLSPTTGHPLRPADAGRVLVGQFFFIHTAQSSVGDRSKQHTYEFLHATFGEYLTAREIVEILRDTATSSISRRGLREPDDDLLLAVLSHQCIAERTPILRFIRDIFDTVDVDERRQVTQVLQTLITCFRRRHGTDKFAKYEPSPVDRVRELATYSANLTLLRVLVEPAGDVPIVELWPTGDSLRQWSSQLALWKAGLDPGGWESVLSLLVLKAGSLTIQAGEKIGYEVQREIKYALLRNESLLAEFIKAGSELHVNTRFFEVRIPQVNPSAIALVDRLRPLTYRSKAQLDLDSARMYPDLASSVDLRNALLRHVSEFASVETSLLAVLAGRVSISEIGTMASSFILPQRIAGASEGIEVFDLRVPDLAASLLKQFALGFDQEEACVLIELLPRHALDAYALMSTLISCPEILQEIPWLQDPEIYAPYRGLLLLMRLAERPGATVSTRRNALFAEIRNRWRTLRQLSTAEMSSELAHGFSSQLSHEGYLARSKELRIFPRTFVTIAD